MNIEISNRRKTGKSTNVWKLNNQKIKEQITGRVGNN